MRRLGYFCSGALWAARNRGVMRRGLIRRRGAASQAERHHGGVRASAGDLSVPRAAGGEQELPLLQLQVRDDVTAPHSPVGPFEVVVSGGKRCSRASCLFTCYSIWWKYLYLTVKVLVPHSGSTYTSQ